MRGRRLSKGDNKVFTGKGYTAADIVGVVDVTGVEDDILIIESGR